MIFPHLRFVYKGFFFSFFGILTFSPVLNPMGDPFLRLVKHVGLFDLPPLRETSLGRSERTSVQ